MIQPASLKNILTTSWRVVRFQSRIVWSALVSFVAFKLVDVVIGLRVPEDQEREGLDITSHGESAYHS